MPEWSPRSTQSSLSFHQDKPLYTASFRLSIFKTRNYLTRGQRRISSRVKAISAGHWQGRAQPGYPARFTCNPESPPTRLVSRSCSFSTVTPLCVFLPFNSNLLVTRKISNCNATLSLHPSRDEITISFSLSLCISDGDQFVSTLHRGKQRYIYMCVHTYITNLYAHRVYILIYGQTCPRDDKPRMRCAWFLLLFYFFHPLNSFFPFLSDRPLTLPRATPSSGYSIRKVIRVAPKWEIKVWFERISSD